LRIILTYIKLQENLSKQQPDWYPVRLYNIFQPLHWGIVTTKQVLILMSKH